MSLVPFGEGTTVYRITCNVCQGQRDFPFFEGGDPRDIVREEGWHLLAVEEGWRSHAYFCPRHILSESEALLKVQHWETQYLLGSQFSVTLNGSRIRAVVDPSLSKREAEKILGHTDRDLWQRHVDDLVGQAIPGVGDIVFYERDLSGYGLFRTKRRGRQIHPEMRRFHTWYAARWPMALLTYDWNPEHDDQPAVCFSGLDGEKFADLRHRLKLPSGRAHVDLNPFQISYPLSDFKKRLTDDYTGR